MKTAYSYRRFSSVGQSTGTSLERQLEIAKDVCADNGWNFVDLPSDKGISGFKGANIHKGALGIFLTKVKVGEVSKGSVLIIEKMDRFSRNEVDLVLPDFLHLLQAGIEIYSVTDSTLYTLELIRKNSMLLNYAVMAMAMANDFSKTLSNRVRKTFSLTYAKAAKGEVVQFGAWQPKWVSLIDGKFILNEKSSILKRIFNEYMSAKSMVGIAKGLINDGVQPIGGGKTWTQSQVKYLLTAESLIGNIEIKGQKFNGYYPSVLTVDEWNRLQSKLNENKNRKGGRKEHGYVASLFPNRVFCSKCGGSVNSHYSPDRKGGINRYYKCTLARYDKCDCRKMAPINSFEENFVLNFLSGNPDTLLNQKHDSTVDEMSALNGQKLQISKQIERLVSLDDLDVDILRSKITTLKAQMVKIEEQISELKMKHNSTTYAPEMIKKVVELFRTDKQTAGKEFVKVLDHIQTVLKDDSKRVELVNLLPSLVQRVDFDLTNRQYMVTFINGTKSDKIHC